MRFLRRNVPPPRLQPLLVADPPDQRRSICSTTRYRKSMHCCQCFCAWSHDRSYVFAFFLLLRARIKGIIRTHRHIRHPDFVNNYQCCSLMPQKLLCVSTYSSSWHGNVSGATGTYIPYSTQETRRVWYPVGGVVSCVTRVIKCSSQGPRRGCDKPRGVIALPHTHRRA